MSTMHHQQRITGVGGVNENVKSEKVDGIYWKCEKKFWISLSEQKDEHEQRICMDSLLDWKIIFLWWNLLFTIVGSILLGKKIVGKSCYMIGNIVWFGTDGKWKMTCFKDGVGKMLYSRWIREKNGENSFHSIDDIHTEICCKMTRYGKIFLIGWINNL